MAKLQANAKRGIPRLSGPQPCHFHVAHPYNSRVMCKLAGLLLSAGVCLVAQKSALFEVQEATIAEVHDAMKASRLTCRELVDSYLKRIAAYDKNGPAINSISSSIRMRWRKPGSWTSALRGRG